MDFLPDIPPDFGPQVSVAFDVDKVSFGDGYVQRAPAGLNSVSEQWPLSWSMLTRAEYDELYSFLKARKGVEAFMWQPPWEDAPKQWVCEELSGERPTSARYASITATFVEDFSL
ncbi:Phage-related protein [Vreelandella subterranea]|uniref:Phage-related protein n=1 Tax=Vreelandella subterranea TaxID=416874 RepID=A0A1H9USY6_9GAMM|nr:phage tail protein [Halomonas subterranea]SES12640.1 Phage-related protein [Halomonas subterranea]